MRVPKVVAICGFKRSGKDTVADWLCQHKGYTRIKIAEPLKDVCATLFCLSSEQLDGHLKDEVDPKWGVSPRRIMQFFGTEVMQHKIQELIPGHDRTFWIQNAITRCCVHTNNEENVVISDLRFMHEYNMLKRHFDKDIVFVKVMSKRVAPETDCHASEKEWESIPCDCMVHNDGTVEELHSHIPKWFDALYLS